LGSWPFRKLYKNTFEDLKKVHQKNGITSGYVSSLNSIFYNDPFEGELDLHEAIKDDPAYKHILTVNPLLPAFKDDIAKGVELFDIKGVRIYPYYHGYTLDNKYVEELCSILAEYKLPLFLTFRIEDERMNYMSSPRIPDTAEIADFMNRHPENSIVLIGIRYSEAEALKDIINSRSNVHLDTSGLKDLLFVTEKLLMLISPDKLVYGSLHPLYCLKSTLLLVEKAEINEKVREMILETNAEFLK
jgi:predicted TIM-barrel fold metal-dependent hydrolase